MIRTVAGDGRFDATGDGGLATRSGLGPLGGVTALREGFLVSAGQRVRRVGRDGRIVTVFADEARSPGPVAALPRGAFAFAEEYGGQVFRVDAGGNAVPVAGGGTATGGS